MGKRKGKTSGKGVGRYSPCHVGMPMHYQQMPYQVIPPPPANFAHLVSTFQDPLGSVGGAVAPHLQSRGLVQDGWPSGRWRNKRSRPRPQTTQNAGGTKQNPTALEGDGHRVCGKCGTKHFNDSLEFCRNPTCKAQLKKVAAPKAKAAPDATRTDMAGTTSSEETLKQYEPAPHSKKLTGTVKRYGGKSVSADLPNTPNEAKEEEKNAKTLADKKAQLAKREGDLAAMRSMQVMEETIKAHEKQIATLSKEISAISPLRDKAHILNEIANKNAAWEKHKARHQAVLENIVTQ